jgi:predicted peptidase
MGQIKSHTVQAGRQAPLLFNKTITQNVGCGYLLFLPDEYEKTDKNWPMIIFLHGMGERGSDLNLVKKHGPPKIVEKQKDFPFIVLSPQCPSDKFWDQQVEVLINLIDEITEKYNVDIDRIYLTGLSLGGFGTWTLSAAAPERFAAISPICGGAEKFLAQQIKNIPVWIFHGARDDIVPVRRSQEMADALKACGGDVKFTIYPDAGHDSWTQTYDNPQLYDWFLKHRKNKR